MDKYDAALAANEVLQREISAFATHLNLPGDHRLLSVQVIEFFNTITRERDAALARVKALEEVGMGLADAIDHLFYADAVSDDLHYWVAKWRTLFPL